MAKTEKKEKKAFVFDTNFIIENRDLKDVYKQLKNDYTIYITRISIEERLGQQKREMTNKLNKIHELLGDLSVYVAAPSIDDEEYIQTLEKGLPKQYEKLFGKNIIPLVENNNTLKWVLERANLKLPPFSDAENSSDKGFKDALMWYSIMEYFKEHGEKNILFVTKDNAILKQKEIMIKEFNEITNKTIDIQSNTFYKELIAGNDHKEKKEKKEHQDIDFVQLRIDINKTTSNICFFDDEDDFGYLKDTFVLKRKLKGDDMLTIMNIIKEKINEHFLEETLKATQVFDYNGYFEDTSYSIQISDLERLVNLHEYVLDNCAEYEKQFCEAVASIFNKNYNSRLDDSLLPF